MALPVFESNQRTNDDPMSSRNGRVIVKGLYSPDGCLELEAFGQTGVQYRLERLRW